MNHNVPTQNDAKISLQPLVSAPRKDPNHIQQNVDNNDYQQFSIGGWSQQQNSKYIAYMDVQIHIFRTKSKRKNLHIFKKLSQFLKTRTAQQCRSHFQKLMLKQKSLIQVRNNWKKVIGQQLYKQYYTQALKAKKQLETHSLSIQNNTLFNTDKQQGALKAKKQLETHSISIQNNTIFNTDKQQGQIQQLIYVTKNQLISYYQQRVQAARLRKLQHSFMVDSNIIPHMPWQIQHNKPQFFQHMQ